MAKTKMVRVNVRRHKKTNPKMSLAVILGLLPAGFDAYAEYKSQGPKGLGVAMIRDFTGFNPNNGYKFSISNLGQGLIPLLAGYGIHKFVGGKLGVNKYLKAIPFVEL